MSARLDPAGAAAFASAAPFPHAVIDGFLEPEAAEAMLAEFDAPAADWKHYYHVNEHKRILGQAAQMGPRTQAVIEALHAPEFVARLEALTGIKGLKPDPELDGGGLHVTPRGGFLNIHADFLVHSRRRNWSRQLNLLLYLNKDWRPEYNGALEFWDKGVANCVRRISPDFNRCVIFQTSRIAFHGYPDPLACPEGASRKVLALYYYVEEAETLALVPTSYQAVPSDGTFRRVAIAVDRWLLAVYSRLKRHLGLRDEDATRLLRFLGPKK